MDGSRCSGLSVHGVSNVSVRNDNFAEFEKGILSGKSTFMSAATLHSKKRPVKRIIALVILVILSPTAIFLYSNFNRLLSDALLKSFNSSLTSDVYELKFEKLRVNLFEGTIRVMNVVLEPREKPLRDYPYINSSFRLRTDRITLKNVELFTLLESNKLEVERVSIYKPDIQLTLDGDEPTFVPFNDSSRVVVQEGNVKKKAIESFGLSEFQLIDASFHVRNLARDRTFEVAKLSISLRNLLIDQHPGMDQLSFQQVNLSVTGFSGRLSKGAVKHVRFDEFNLEIDSLNIHKNVDTLTFRLDDFRAGVKKLDLHTGDSLFHFAMGSFDLSYKKGSMRLGDVLFAPNISDAEMQKRYVYQHTQVAGSVASVILTHVNFDTLLYHRALIIDSIVLDRPDISIFKDNTKPMDMNRFPPYFGQQLRAVPVSLCIKQVLATNVKLMNVERKRDSSYAKVIIHRGTAVVRNITNRSPKPMTLHADAYIDNKVHFSLQLGFSYQKPEFSLAAKFDTFSLPDLNPVIQAYTPAKINAGTADEIAFSGVASEKKSTGTMKFLYHDLNVDLELHNKAKWKSSVIAFAANSIVDSSNPPSLSLPPRIVKFQVARDVNKGFVNLIIKSALMGVKETLIMSKENRKEYKKSKKQARTDSGK